LRLAARYDDRIAEAPESRALVTPNGRPLPAVPSSWRTEGRRASPPGRGRGSPRGGGRLTLPSGETAIAESVGPAEEAFLVRSAERPARRATRPLARPTVLGGEGAGPEGEGGRA